MLFVNDAFLQCTGAAYYCQCRSATVQEFFCISARYQAEHLRSVHNSCALVHQDIRGKTFWEGPPMVSCEARGQSQALWQL